MALLKKRGVPADLITIGGAGNLDPAELGQSEKARSLNRRVTVTVRLEDEP
jgi:outer membrane protein OmpA-like peptidoglycan-associated protein